MTEKTNRHQKWSTSVKWLRGDYRDMCIGDDERVHWYFYREPEPRHPNSADVTEDFPS